MGGPTAFKGFIIISPTVVGTRRSTGDKLLQEDSHNVLKHYYFHYTCSIVLLDRWQVRASRHNTLH